MVGSAVSMLPTFGPEGIPSFAGWPGFRIEIRDGVEVQLVETEAGSLSIAARVVPKCGYGILQGDGFADLLQLIGPSAHDPLTPEQLDALMAESD